MEHLLLPLSGGRVRINPHLSERHPRERSFSSETRGRVVRLWILERQSECDMPPHMDYFSHESRVPSDCVLTREDELDPGLISCMLVGDGAVGKTSMIISYISNGYPVEYQQTGFDVFSGQVQVDGSAVKVQLLDTAGQEEFDEFRALSYAHTDVFLLCFSMVNPTSFHNITKKWVPEIRAHNPSSPIILIGTQMDMMLDVNVLINLDQCHVKPVPSTRARSMADKIRATDYIECSSLTQKNLKEAFDAAIFAAMKNKARKNKKRRFSDRKTKAFSRCSWKKVFCFV
ncbi:Rho-related GTP-binding protein RhoV [Oryzias melastigma]|uniref:Ras homolog family member V n=1 Tax=Oryzias melastigma TaxID=30732 RepID=A0A3B3D1B2_ORYME|nr:rho-related GTP-binding protein RhoV [Oryzias melastigma]KAF6730392.1 Rho-related GTP-binding protein RhoV [Oryzias melastigma]